MPLHQRRHLRLGRRRAVTPSEAIPPHGRQLLLRSGGLVNGDLVSGSQLDHLSAQISHPLRRHARLLHRTVQRICRLGRHLFRGEGSGQLRAPELQVLGFKFVYARLEPLSLAQRLVGLALLGRRPRRWE